MKKRKTNSGITLVALIITIIVLLILAVVSIRAITGGEGIFTKAENATQRYEEERLREENTRNEYDKLIDQNLPKITGKAYELDGLLCILTSDNRFLLIQNNKIVANLSNISYGLELEDGWTIKDDNNIEYSTYIFGDANNEGKMVPFAAISKDKTKLYQGEGSSKNKEFQISSNCMTLNESIDVSKYL